MSSWIGPLACGSLFAFAKLLLSKGFAAGDVAAITAIGGFAIGYADGLFSK